MKDKINLNNIPKHIAVIMDGNGRWAKGKGAQRLFGHKHAVKAVREVTEGCAELGVGYLTLYAFSTENWSRPKEEVNGLMNLLVLTLKDELQTLSENNIQLATIGDTDKLPKKAQKELRESIEATAGNDGMILTLALSYSGRRQIIEAMKNIAKDYKDNHFDLNDIDERMISRYLNPMQHPDPELLIRTSGEMRISNFLLWQIAYTELYMTNVLWPDFRKQHLYEALLDYQKRERRFGKISEQVKV